MKTIQEQLKNAVSFETAYQVDDYPYGFRLRCKIRYWIEYRKNHGYRLCTRTTNPTKSSEFWNKCKTFTYTPLSLFLYIEESSGHVKCKGFIRSHGEISELEKYLEDFKDWLPLNQIENVQKYIEIKTKSNLRLKEIEAGKQLLSEG